MTKTWEEKIISLKEKVKTLKDALSEARKQLKNTRKRQRKPKRRLGTKNLRWGATTRSRGTRPRGGFGASFGACSVPGPECLRAFGASGCGLLDRRVRAGAAGLAVGSE